jgi:hypothetical protein
VTHVQSFAKAAALKLTGDDVAALDAASAATGTAQERAVS